MSTSSSSGRAEKSILISSLIGGVVLVVLGVVIVGAASPPGNHSRTQAGGSSTTSVTEVSPCAQPPTLAASSVSAGSSGLIITADITTNCPSGDLLSNSGFRVTAVDSAGHDVASGVFDIASHPIAIGAGGTSVTFTFPSNSYWRTPDAINGDVRLTAYSEGSNGPVATGTESASAATATRPGAPSSGDVQTAAQSGLTDMAAADRNAIDAGLLDQWQPQLSSKQPGLFADGITWSAADIIREHLDLRQRFPSARLVWSGDWPVFNDPSWWVTVAGETFGSGDDANAWCASEGFDADHCFAKILSRSRGAAGTTLLRN